MRNPEPRKRGPIYSDVPNPTPVMNPELPTNWRCMHCKCTTQKTDSVKPGPRGPKSLCNSCGKINLKIGSYWQTGILPDYRLDMFKFVT